MTTRMAGLDLAGWALYLFPFVISTSVLMRWWILALRLRRIRGAGSHFVCLAGPGRGSVRANRRFIVHLVG